MTLNRNAGRLRPSTLPNRTIREILGGVDYFMASENGPNGPWLYKSLSVRRVENTIYVRDVDGEMADTIAVESLPNGDEAIDALKRALDRTNEETLEAL